jgi:ABC-type amino acid transport substrate-binding protein
MKEKNKIFTVLILMLILFLLAGFGAFKPKLVSGGSGTQKIKKLGGVECRMPENSALVFFGSTFGVDLTSYKAYKDFDEALFSLKAGKVDAVWACDVSADYLLKTNENLVKSDMGSMSDIQKTEDPRFTFGMALKKDSGEALRDEINSALNGMRSDGTLDGIIEKYVRGAEFFETEEGKKERYFPDMMKKASGKGTIKVGISGAVPPLELFDEDGDPYGFCVAMMEEVGLRTGRSVKFVRLDNETAFTQLLSGRVDVIFSYGTGRITTEYKQKFIVTDGYLDMQRYEMLQIKK